MESKFQLPWWLSLISGFFFVFIGWQLITNTALATVDLIVLLGLYWIVSGIIDLISLVFDHERKHIGLRLAASIIGIIAGLVVVNHAVVATVITVTFLTYFVAFAFMFNGFAHMFMGGESKTTGVRKWSWGSLIIGIIYVLFGIFIIAGPTIFVAAGFLWAMGIFAIICGILLIASTFAFKK